MSEDMYRFEYKKFVFIILRYLFVTAVGFCKAYRVFGSVHSLTTMSFLSSLRLSRAQPRRLPPEAVPLRTEDGEDTEHFEDIQGTSLTIHAGGDGPS